ncbi:hypothetical protein JQ032_15170 [Clostridium botulinum]|nr:hypothetical protein [Clostridium botulinum]MCS4526774.1 hypothetical protein [Clostridium botulinum]
MEKGTYKIDSKLVAKSY